MQEEQGERHEKLANMDVVPIQGLTPGNAPTAGHTIRAIVTLYWPYSSSTKQCALLLADPDFRLRSRQGQIRVRFSGASAEAVAKSHVGIGDEVLLGLGGGRWADEVEVTKTPGRSVDGELLFENKLDLKIERDGAQVVVKVDAPRPSLSAAVELIPATPAPRPSATSRVSLGEVLGGVPTYSSPAFAKRLRLSGSAFLDATYDPFAEDDMFATQLSKKQRRSFGTSQWRYADESPLTVELPKVMDNTLTVDDNVLEATMQAPEERQESMATPSMLPPVLSQLQMLSTSVLTDVLPTESGGPATPKLEPVLSSTLPLPSPFPQEARTLMFARSEPTLVSIESEKQSPALDLAGRPREASDRQDTTRIDHESIGAPGDDPGSLKDARASGNRSAHNLPERDYPSDTEPDEDADDDSSLRVANATHDRNDLSTPNPEAVGAAQTYDAIETSAATAFADPTSASSKYTSPARAVTAGNFGVHNDDEEADAPDDASSFRSQPQTPVKLPKKLPLSMFGLDGVSGTPSPQHVVTPKSVKEKVMARTFSSLFGFRTSSGAAAPPSETQTSLAPVTGDSNVSRWDLGWTGSTSTLPTPSLAEASKSWTPKQRQDVIPVSEMVTNRLSAARTSEDSVGPAQAKSQLGNRAQATATLARSTRRLDAITPGTDSLLERGRLAAASLWKSSVSSEHSDAFHETENTPETANSIVEDVNRPNDGLVSHRTSISLPDLDPAEPLAGRAIGDLDMASVIPDHSPGQRRGPILSMDEEIALPDAIDMTSQSVGIYADESNALDPTASTVSQQEPNVSTRGEISLLNILDDNDDEVELSQMASKSSVSTTSPLLPGSAQEQHVPHDLLPEDTVTTRPSSPHTARSSPGAEHVSVESLGKSHIPQPALVEPTIKDAIVELPTKSQLSVVSQRSTIEVIELDSSSEAEREGSPKAEDADAPGKPIDDGIAWDQGEYEDGTQWEDDGWSPEPKQESEPDLDVVSTDLYIDQSRQTFGDFYEDGDILYAEPQGSSPPQILNGNTDLLVGGAPSANGHVKSRSATEDSTSRPDARSALRIDRLERAELGIEPPSIETSSLTSLPADSSPTAFSGTYASDISALNYVFPDERVVKDSEDELGSDPYGTHPVSPVAQASEATIAQDGLRASLVDTDVQVDHPGHGDRFQASPQPGTDSVPSAYGNALLEAVWEIEPETMVESPPAFTHSHQTSENADLEIEPASAIWERSDELMTVPDEDVTADVFDGYSKTEARQGDPPTDGSPFDSQVLSFDVDETNYRRAASVHIDGVRATVESVSDVQHVSSYREKEFASAGFVEIQGEVDSADFEMAAGNDDPDLVTLRTESQGLELPVASGIFDVLRAGTNEVTPEAGLEMRGEGMIKEQGQITSQSQLPPTPLNSQALSASPTPHAYTQPAIESALPLTPQLTQVEAPVVSSMEGAMHPPVPAGSEGTPAKKSFSTRLSNVPDVISAWFSPKKSTSSTPTTFKWQSKALVSEPRAASGVIKPHEVQDVKLHQTQHEDLHSATTTGIATSMGYFTPLARLEALLNSSSQAGANTVDVLAVVTDRSSPVQRASSGPRDFFSVCKITDPSLGDANVRVDIFRPWKAKLPYAEVGDVILLRSYAVKSKSRQPYLLSTDASGWCVWRYGNAATTDDNEGKRIWASKSGHKRRNSSIREEMKGPPVELGEEERRHARGLREWWETSPHAAGRDDRTDVTSRAYSLRTSRPRDCKDASAVCSNSVV